MSVLFFTVNVMVTLALYHAFPDTSVPLVWMFGCMYGAAWTVFRDWPR